MTHIVLGLCFDTPTSHQIMTGGLALTMTTKTTTLPTKKWVLFLWWWGEENCWPTEYHLPPRNIWNIWGSNPACSWYLFRFYLELYLFALLFKSILIPRCAGEIIHANPIFKITIKYSNYDIRWVGNVIIVNFPILMSFKVIYIIK